MIPLRLLVLGLLLTVCGAPAHAEVRCDTRQVETLTAHLPAAPSTLRAGRPLEVAVDVVRADGTAAQVGAGDVQVLVSLTGKGWGAYDSALSEADGTVTAHVVVPAGVRGAASLDVEVFRDLVNLPCLRVEEHGRTQHAWGQVR